MQALKYSVGLSCQRVDVSAYTVPTDFHESDGTLEWDSTTLVLVEATAGNTRGLGFTYADTATARLIIDRLVPIVLRHQGESAPAIWRSMVRSIRNLGRPGICSMAIAAVDNALWDLTARLLDIPLATLIGAGAAAAAAGSTRQGVPVYGSGGFTSYSIPQLQRQLSGWASDGIALVKMKVGRHPQADAERVAAAREAIGPGIGLFVDANGAYDVKQALRLAELFARSDVTWFEEPVSSDDLAGLAFIRDHAPGGMEIAAGEYGYDLPYFRRMIGSVDVLQADVTRCAGISEFLRIAALCDAFSMPLSAHTAPALHAQVCLALPSVRHIEYFHDHARIEQMFFDGAQRPHGGALSPDLSRPGMGLEFKHADAEQFRVG